MDKIIRLKSKVYWLGITKDDDNHALLLSNIVALPLQPAALAYWLKNRMESVYI
jgi:hypothetical protein